LTQPANVTETNILIKYQYQSGLDVSGNVFFLNSSRSLNGKTLNLFPKKSASGNFLLTDSLDPAGNFHLGNVFLENSTEMCWNIDGINNRQLDKIRLTLTKSWFDSMRIRPTILKKEIAIKKDSGIDMIVKKTFQQYFSADSFQNKKFKTLPEVTIFVQERKRIEELDNKYANTSLFGGRLGNVFAFDIENEKGQYPSIISYLQGRIPGLTVFGPIYNPLLIYRAPMNLSTTPSTNVAVFVNENRIYEPDQFASIPLDEIAYVKVFKPPFSYVLVSEVPEGLHDPVKSLVIAIYLKKEAKINSFPILAALKSFSVKGFSLPTNFPLPNYSEEKEMENIPDKRITLYWDPEVNFINGKAKIVFYNNDFSKRYLIKLEGINELGEVVSFQQVIEK
jgi:hypothetical protein